MRVGGRSGRSRSAKRMTSDSHATGGTQEPSDRILDLGPEIAGCDARTHPCAHAAVRLHHGDIKIRDELLSTCSERCEPAMRVILIVIVRNRQLPKVRSDMTPSALPRHHVRAQRHW